MDAKRPTPGHIIRPSADFSKETLQARRDWQEIFKVMKRRDLQPRLSYPAKISFRIKGQIKNFSDKKDQNCDQLNVKKIHIFQ